jgi:hypothetical protein
MRRLLNCLLLLFSTAAAHAACSVTERATVPLQPEGGLRVVPVMVNGLEARFILDTGAQRTIVTREAVQRLDLALDEWVATTIHGVSGGERNRNADPRSITLGGIALRHRSVAHDSSLIVANLPRIGPGQPIDGLLGRDFLSAFDLALDLPAQTLTLYEVQGCSGRFLPWTRPYTVIPVAEPMDTALVVPVTIDGIRLRALLDTGATASLIAAPGMTHLGLIPDQQNGPTHDAHGIGPHGFQVRSVRFETFQVGPQPVEHGITLPVAPIRGLVPVVDMLLGEDWLAGKLVWLSYATRQIFVAG